MTLKQVKARQLIELSDYGARYRVRVMSRTGFADIPGIYGKYRSIINDKLGNILGPGLFKNPTNITLAKVKRL